MNFQQFFAFLKMNAQLLAQIKAHRVVEKTLQALQFNLFDLFDLFASGGHR